MLSREAAELIGLQAVAWLAGNDELLPVFLGATGAAEDDFRAALEDPSFQGAVLEDAPGMAVVDLEDELDGALGDDVANTKTPLDPDEQPKGGC